MIFFFLKMCLRNECNLNKFYHVFVLNFNDFGGKISFIMKDAGVLISRCSGPHWFIHQFVGREKPYKMMQFHVYFAAGEAVKMSLEDW